MPRLQLDFTGQGSRVLGMCFSCPVILFYHPLQAEKSREGVVEKGSVTTFVQK